MCIFKYVHMRKSFTLLFIQSFLTLCNLYFPEIWGLQFRGDTPNKNPPRVTLFLVTPLNTPILLLSCIFTSYLSRKPLGRVRGTHFKINFQSWVIFQTFTWCMLNGTFTTKPSFVTILKIVVFNCFTQYVVASCIIE